jgi:hypothetical protein
MRTREGRGRPRFAALKQSEDRAGGSVDWRSQHDDGGGVDRDEREAAGGGLDADQRPQSGAQAAELDPKTGPMRLVGCAGLEGALDELIARHILRPGLGEGADEVEEDGTSGERDTAGWTVNRAPAAIDDEVAGGEEALDFLEADQANSSKSASSVSKVVRTSR